VDNTVLIKENWLNGHLYPLALRFLLQSFGAHCRYIAYCPQGSGGVSAQAFGMIKYYTKAARPAQESTPYFGLAKD
jgi:hypothetical protein